MPGPNISTYLLQVRLLLHDPNAQFYTDATLSSFIDQARQQVSAEGEMLRGIGSVTTTVNVQLYAHSGVAVPTTINVSSLLKIRTIRRPSSVIYSGNVSGDLPLEGRSWDWFNWYWLTLGPHPPGPPRAWAPFVDGNDGSFYIAPSPNASNYTLSIDGVWLPSNLTGVSTPDIIPQMWTDAVQYYACYLACLDGQRYSDADHMLELYELHMGRARSMVTPSTLTQNYPGGMSSRNRGAPGQPPPTTINPQGGG